MKTTLFLPLLSCTIALPALGDLTDVDLNRIRLILNEELKSIRDDIVSLKTGVALIQGKFESVSDQITHVTYLTYGLIVLIVAAVAIPQILFTLRSGRDRALEKQMEMLTQEIETLKHQRIVNP